MGYEIKSLKRSYISGHVRPNSDHYEMNIDEALCNDFPTFPGDCLVYEVNEIRAGT